MRAVSPFNLRSLFLERDGALTALCLAALCLLAWLYLAHLAGQMETMEGVAARMMGMPVQDGLSAWLAAALSPTAAANAETSVNITLVAAMWAIMMVGMMLPSAAPTILLFAALERKRPGGAEPGRNAGFGRGYLITWGLFSIVAAILQTVLAATGLLSMQMAATGSLLAGALFIAAGLYELTPLKQRCLTHCQSPLTWLPRHMRPGRGGAVRMGLEHGSYCVGCCFGLMLLLFVGGVMNLAWVAAIAALVLAQKLLPPGRWLARLSGVALLICGAVLMIGTMWPAG